MLFVSAICSGAAPTSRASAARSRSGTSVKCASVSRLGVRFSSIASSAASWAARGSGPWCAQFSHARPWNGPNSADSAACPIRRQS